MGYWRRRLAPSAIALILALGVVPSGASSASGNGGLGNREYVKVGYFLQWGIYGRAFFVKNLHENGSAGRLTHINYAFGNVTGGMDVVDKIKAVKTGANGPFAKDAPEDPVVIKQLRPVFNMADILAGALTQEERQIEWRAGGSNFQWLDS